MSNNVVHQHSISELHSMLNLGKPTHPLITILDVSKLEIGEEVVGMKIMSDMYCIALKDASCGMDYGRNHYDFDEGVLMFTGPQQVLTPTRAHQLGEIQGWMLYFHPDLIRNMPLGSRIDSYTFFSYDIHEALHLSEQEQATLTNCIEMIRTEINERIDDHSQQVLVSNLELLLNYCSRYYSRQFNTRSAQNSDVVSKVESVLKDYYHADLLGTQGQPSIQFLADKVHLSPSYLTDLLTKETGLSAKEHINEFLIDKAKYLLLSSSDTISGIAYSLGFNYPHYFARMFKRKVGMTPKEYRVTN